MSKRIGIVCIFPLMLLGCGEDKVAELSDSSSNVLVRVNGHPITDVDLTVTTDRLFARGATSHYAEGVREKALESMVMMMAIAQQSEAKASVEELQEIDAKSRRYREELLTELYIRKFADVTPPSEKQIADYYEANRALFGEKPVKQFDLVRTKHKPEGDALSASLERLNGLSAKTWAEHIIKMKNDNDMFEVVSSTTDVPNLDRALLRVVAGLQEGQISNVVYLNDQPQIIMLVKETKKNARPLHEVRNTIRKTLAAQKLKQHIKDVSAEILVGANVQYTADEK